MKNGEEKIKAFEDRSMVEQVKNGPCFKFTKLNENDAKKCSECKGDHQLIVTCGVNKDGTFTQCECNNIICYDCFLILQIDYYCSCSNCDRKFCFKSCLDGGQPPALEFCESKLCNDADSYCEDCRPKMLLKQCGYDVGNCWGLLGIESVSSKCKKWIHERCICPANHFNHEDSTEEVSEEEFSDLDVS